MQRVRVLLSVHGHDVELSRGRAVMADARAPVGEDGRQLGYRSAPAVGGASAEGLQHRSKHVVVSKHLQEPDALENPEMGVVPDGHGHCTLGQNPASSAPAQAGFLPPF